MKNRKLLLIISVVLALTMSLGGTLAYLTDTDSDVNVMTLGNVKIEQLENGVDGPIAKDPLYPAYYEGDDWEEETAETITGEIKKIVTVENKGSSDAYIRTLFAFEAGDLSFTEFKNKIHTVFNDDDSVVKINWFENAPIQIEIEDAETNEKGTYFVAVATYVNPLTTDEAGKVSAPSLEYLFMDKAANNEDVAKFGTDYRVYVLTQAAQTINFDTLYATGGAGAVLDEAFDEVNATTAAAWFKGIVDVSNAQVEYAGTIYATIHDAVEAANANGGGTITLKGSAELDKPVEIKADIIINGNGHTLTRADDFTGTMLTVKAGATLTLNETILDGEKKEVTGNLIATEGNGSIVLNADTVLQNNNGAHAVNLGTREGATLTLNGAQIINNSSDSGAIWGGGDITINAGSKINNNSSTGSAGAIRMVGQCNLTMNGGEICNNTAATDGGAIWGYGVRGNSSVYNLNGGKISGNTAGGTGGAIYTGNYSTINISGDFELCDNKATNSGAIRLTDHTSMNMTGGKVSGNTQSGESNAFNTWNNSISITGGKLDDNMFFVGGLGLTIGEADITGVISYDLSTNHNTAYLAKEFNRFEFKVNETDEHFGNFNFKPAADYTYTAGDEAKLVCLNEGYSTYWDAATGTFRLQAD